MREVKKISKKNTKQGNRVTKQKKVKMFVVCIFFCVCIYVSVYVNLRNQCMGYQR